MSPYSGTLKRFYYYYYCYLYITTETSPTGRSGSTCRAVNRAKQVKAAKRCVKPGAFLEF